MARVADINVGATDDTEDIELVDFSARVPTGGVANTLDCTTVELTEQDEMAETTEVVGTVDEDDNLEDMVTPIADTDEADLTGEEDMTDVIDGSMTVDVPTVDTDKAELTGVETTEVVNWYSR